MAKTKAILNEEEVQQNPDMRIDQDFPGFPHHPAHKKSIGVEPKREKKQPGPLKKQSKK